MYPGNDMSFISMQVVKRDGQKEDVSFDKVLNRIRKSSDGLEVNPTLIAQRTLTRIYDGVKTSELDELAAQLAISLMTTNPDYGTLASRIIISNHHKSTSDKFTEVVKELANQTVPKTGEKVSNVSQELIDICEKYGDLIDEKIDYSRDYLFDYFGFKTLEKLQYLLRNSSGITLERPQHLIMRVSLALWGSIDIEKAFETYDLLSQKYFIHATPTNFNAGTPRQQLSSCFVAGTPVFTTNGVKNIEDVEIGDEVVTHTGLVKKVLQKHCNPLNNRTIYDVKLAGTPTVSVTGNHRLYSISEEQEKWGREPSWNSVDYLRVGDWVAIPNKKGGEVYTLDVKDILDTLTNDGNNITYRFEYKDDKVIPYALWKKHFANEKTISSEKKGDPFNRYWIFDDNLMELMGIWYGDGCVVHGKNSSRQMKPRAINIVSYYNNTELINFVTNTIYNSLGIKHLTVSQDKNNMVAMTLNNQYIAYIFKYLFKSGFDGKRIPSFFNRLPKSGIQSFLSGLVSSDGCVSSEGSITIQLTNPPLVSDIFHLARSVGIPITMTLMHKHDGKSTGRMSIPSSIVCGKIKKVYCDNRIEKYNNKNINEWRQTRIINGMTFMRINNKIPTDKKPEFVYTLGVEDDHSYSVGGFIAENCFLLAMKDDSIVGIYDTLKQCAQISKHAGGIGLHIHNIRAKGALIKGTNGTSNGIVPMLRNFNDTARYVDQGGGKRNGSFAIYLEPWHADVEDFLKLKLNTGAEEERARDLFYALWLPDLFMERVEKDEQWTFFCPSEAPGLADVYGDEFKELYERYEREGRGRKQVPAQKLWFKILDAQIETGTPYLLYKDAANMKSNQKNLGTIKSSNLCVAPETYILTDKGQRQIHELAGQEVNVWNGDKWSKTTVMKTGENQKLITVHLSNGAQITCTPYHKFIVRDSYDDNSPIKDAKRVDASELKEGMKLAKWESPVIEGDIQYDFKEPYTHGFFCGDGNEFSNGNGQEYKRVILCGAKKELIPKLCLVSIGNEQKNGTIQALIPKDLKSKYEVPINSSIVCRVQWLAGLLDADGGVHKGTNVNTDLISLTSINKEFLNNVRLLLLSLGVQSKVIQCKPEREETFPDGKVYKCKALYHIPIGGEGIWRLTQLGMRCNRLTYRISEPKVKNNQHYTRVVSVVDDGRTDDTYCFNEPDNHAGVFNGVLTGNCTEIIEYSSPSEAAVCNLASIALPTYVDQKSRKFNYDKLREVTKVVIKNLNRVIDINYYPTPETRRSNMRHRPVGLGVQGLADVFAMMRAPWESAKAADLNQRIFEHMYYAAVESSIEIAEKEGPYETYEGSPASKGQLQYDMWNKVPLTQQDGTLDWQALKEKMAKHGLRNSLLIAPMPTASTSQILGFNECFELFTSNIYTRRTLAGEFIIVNKHLMRDLQRLEMWNEDMKQQIIARNGSIQDIEGIPESIQNLYKTSWEIKQKVLIDMAAARGAFICQSQSLNLFVADPNYAKLTSMHFYGWKQGLKTGIYYLRTRAPVMAQKFTIDPELQKAAEKSEHDRIAKKYQVDEGCVMCSA